MKAKFANNIVQCINVMLNQIIIWQTLLLFSHLILCDFKENYTYMWKKYMYIYNRWKGNYPRYPHWHNINFYSGKIIGTKTDFLWKFIDIFSPFGIHSKYLAQFFNVILRALSCLLQYKTPADFFINSRFFETW